MQTCPSLNIKREKEHTNTIVDNSKWFCHGRKNIKISKEMQKIINHSK
jgi:hypothetical protein